MHLNIFACKFLIYNLKCIKDSEISLFDCFFSLKIFVFFRPYVEISGSENRTIKVMLAGSPKSSELRKTLIVRFSTRSVFLARFRFCFESLFY